MPSGAASGDLWALTGDLLVPLLSVPGDYFVVHYEVQSGEAQWDQSVSGSQKRSESGMEFSAVSAFGIVAVVWVELRDGSWVWGQASVDERGNVSAVDFWTVG